jgi:hypothetical protein
LQIDSQQQKEPQMNIPKTPNSIRNQHALFSGVSFRGESKTNLKKIDFEPLWPEDDEDLNTNQPVASWVTLAELQALDANGKAGIKVSVLCPDGSFFIEPKSLKVDTNNKTFKIKVSQSQGGGGGIAAFTTRSAILAINPKDLPADAASYRFEIQVNKG